MGYLLLLLLRKTLLLNLLSPFLAQLVERLAEVLFHFLVSSEGGAHLVEPVIELGRNHLRIDIERVYAGLHQKQFGLHHALKELAAYVTVGAISLGPHHLHLRLKVRERDHLVAHHGHGFVNHTLIFLRLGYGTNAEQGCQSC